MQRNTLWHLTVCLACLGFTTVAHAFPQPGAGKSGPSQPPGRTATLPTQNFSRTPLISTDTAKKFDLPRQDATVKTPLVIDSTRKIDPQPMKTQPLVLADTSKRIEAKTLPKIVGPDASHDAKRELATMPAIKLHHDAKFNAQDLAKIKPMIDLSKVKPSEVLAKKPPQDFQMKKLDLAKIHVPTDAPQVAKLNAGQSFAGQKFVLNQNKFQGNNYHLQFGKKYGSSWCYPGIHHHHWHHCIWDPCYQCNYFYDPCLCCYYYYNVTDTCYYPCWWFVNYCDTYYPWWTCGGFQSVGYQLPRVQVGIRFGW
jgi:hypothetical protein